MSFLEYDIRTKQFSIFTRCLYFASSFLQLNRNTPGTSKVQYSSKIIHRKQENRGFEADMKQLSTRHLSPSKTPPISGAHVICYHHNIYFYSVYLPCY